MDTEYLIFLAVWKDVYKTVYVFDTGEIIRGSDGLMTRHYSYLVHVQYLSSNSAFIWVFENLKLYCSFSIADVTFCGHIIMEWVEMRNSCFSVRPEWWFWTFILRGFNCLIIYVQGNVCITHGICYGATVHVRMYTCISLNIYWK